MRSISSGQSVVFDTRGVFAEFETVHCTRNPRRHTHSLHAGIHRLDSGRGGRRRILFQARIKPTIRIEKLSPPQYRRLFLEMGKVACPAPALWRNSAMDINEAISGRRSVREYDGEAVDEPTIRSLIDAAVRAPER
jgi:hypothetical protein